MCIYDDSDEGHKPKHKLLYYKCLDLFTVVIQCSAPWWHSV